jgi:hypothetical protein
MNAVSRAWKKHKAYCVIENLHPDIPQTLLQQSNYQRIVLLFDPGIGIKIPYDLGTVLNDLKTLLVQRKILYIWTYIGEVRVDVKVDLVVGLGYSRRARDIGEIRFLCLE